MQRNMAPFSDWPPNFYIIGTDGLKVCLHLLLAITALDQRPTDVSKPSVMPFCFVCFSNIFVISCWSFLGLICSVSDCWTISGNQWFQNIQNCCIGLRKGFNGLFLFSQLLADFLIYRLISFNIMFSNPNLFSKENEYWPYCFSTFRSDCISVFICSIKPPCSAVWIKIATWWWHTANTPTVQLTASPNIFLSPHGLQELNTITVYSELSSFPQCTELMKRWWTSYIKWSAHFLTDLFANLKLSVWHQFF